MPAPLPRPRGAAGPGGPHRPSRARRASRGLAVDSPLLQSREAPLPGEPERPVRLAPALSVFGSRLLLLFLLPPPPRAHALPHSASFKPGSSCRRIPGRSLAPPGSKFTETLRGFPRLSNPGGVAHSPAAGAVAQWPRARRGVTLRPPSRPALQAFPAARGLAGRRQLEATPGAGRKGMSSRPSSSKHLRHGRERPGEGWKTGRRRRRRNKGTQAARSRSRPPSQPERFSL
ncbi:translation initiation factor IF-2-like [Rhinolophus ferrumequinum]|uniref:translation initiation factor IF-2-like n=1 Tax=Rhinolophus ferrumequinum TaxID=59479 RepID=UPI00140F4FEF|nr:translation initiation factor IF-2-like [Rhinolophus ferrumequinum]